MIIAEYREKVGHHELQAAHAEEERRIPREESWRQKLEFREVHQQSLTRIPHTHSGGFIGFQNTRKFCLIFVRFATPTILHNLTGHSRSN